MKTTPKSCIYCSKTFSLKIMYNLHKKFKHPNCSTSDVRITDVRITVSDIITPEVKVQPIFEPKPQFKPVIASECCSPTMISRAYDDFKKNH